MNRKQKNHPHARQYELASLLTINTARFAEIESQIKFVVQ